LKLRKISDARVLEEVERARHNVRVLIAHGDGGLKRRLGLMGDYSKHRDAAAKAVIDNAFYLSVALEVMDAPWPLGALLARRFKARAVALDRSLADAYAPPEDT
jgi:hypothetical protein